MPWYECFDMRWNFYLSLGVIIRKQIGYLNSMSLNCDYFSKATGSVAEMSWLLPFWSITSITKMTSSMEFSIECFKSLLNVTWCSSAHVLQSHLLMLWIFCSDLIQSLIFARQLYIWLFNISDSFSLWVQNIVNGLFPSKIDSPTDA